MSNEITISDNQAGKRIVEIDGVKIEVDMRTAKKVEEFRVGSPIKILVKNGPSDSSVYPAVIVDFEEFASLPTITVAYIKSSYYNSTNLEFAYINANSTSKYEIVPANSQSRLHIDKKEIINRINDDIASKEYEIKVCKEKKRIFLAKFGAYFSTEDVPNDA